MDATRRRLCGAREGKVLEEGNTAGESDLECFLSRMVLSESPLSSSDSKDDFDEDFLEDVDILKDANASGGSD